MRELGKLVLGVVAGAVMIVAALQWWSWHWLAQTDQYVKELAARGWIEDEKAWQRHYEALQARRMLVPMDASVHWQLGELYRWRGAGMYLWPDRQRTELEAAQQQYAQAITRSPRNGRLLARIAARLATADGQFAVALTKRAMDIAPYEPVVQYHVAEVAFQHWAELEEADKKHVRTMLSHALKRSSAAAKIRKLAENYGHVNWLARLEDGKD